MELECIEVMILPTYTEEQILQELVADYAGVKRKAKKIADTYLDKAKKSGRYIRKTEYKLYTIETPNYNSWFIVIEFNQTYKNPWTFRSCCVVENEKTSKQYYILRGLSINEPYFILLTSHTLKRIRERAFNTHKSITLEMLACWALEHREIVVGVKYVDLKYLPLLSKIDDSDKIDNLSYFILTNHGAYFSKKTPKGNYVFKTYITTMMGLKESLNVAINKLTKFDKEGKLFWLMFVLHQYYNKELYEKDSLDAILYEVIGKGKGIKLIEKSPAVILKN